MVKSILTKQQANFLRFLGTKQYLSNVFYLTGGTALSAYYLYHRISEDLDFFSQKEIDILAVTSFIKEAKKTVKYSTFDYQQSFNRNLYQLSFPHSFLKVEFTYFPFERVEPSKKINGVFVDSLMDIAVNKLFTIHQSPRGRDYYDLYSIVQKMSWDIDDLIRKTRIKFDTHIDKIQLGTQFMKADTFLDDPIIKGKQKTQKQIVQFFHTEAVKFKPDILT